MRPFKITKVHKQHLMAQDPVLAQLIKKLPNIDRSYDTDYFKVLISSIIYQQISLAAGGSIWNRFTCLVNPLTPVNLMSKDSAALKSCGLSTGKVTYVQAIAEAFSSGALSSDIIENSSPESLLTKLTAIKGIGVWTAEMFFMFALGLEDVFSFKDLGLRRGIEWLYDIKAPVSSDTAEQLTRLWSPYKTIAAFYLWEITTQNLDKNNRNDVLGPPAYQLNVPGKGYYHSPLGLIEICASQKGITALQYCNHQGSTNETPLILWAIDQLKAYFSGHLQHFSVPLDMTGSDFQLRVYQCLSAIPYGETQTYGGIAAAMGSPKASRAVGGANNKNPIMIIVPCHRIIGASGKLVGYAGGMDKKEWLLHHEAKNRPHTF